MPLFRGKPRAAVFALVRPTLMETGPQTCWQPMDWFKVGKFGPMASPTQTALSKLDPTPSLVVAFKNYSANSLAASSQKALTISDPRLLLNPAKLASLRQEAAANTAQWQAFKARLDQNLTAFVNWGDYQGGSLNWIADYALGYQVLKDTDPTTRGELCRQGNRDHEVGPS